MVDSPDLKEWSLVVARALGGDAAFACPSCDCATSGDASLLTHDALEVYAEESVRALLERGVQDGDVVSTLRLLRRGLRDSRLAGNYPARFDDENAWLFSPRGGADETDGASVRRMLVRAAQSVSVL